MDERSQQFVRDNQAIESCACRGVSLSKLVDICDSVDNLVAMHHHV